MIFYPIIKKSSWEKRWHHPVIHYTKQPIESSNVYHFHRALLNLTGWCEKVMFGLARGLFRGASVLTYWFGSVPSLTYLMSLSLALTEVCVRSALNLRRFQSKWHFWSVLIGWRLTSRGRNKGQTIPCFLQCRFLSAAKCIKLAVQRFFLPHLF